MNYNPSAPVIIGNEFCPIRDEDVIYTPAINSVELGYGFTATTDLLSVADARFYVKEQPPGRAVGQVFLASIYRGMNATRAGIVQSVTIPCNAGAVTGAASLVGASTVAQALADPGDNSYVQFPGGSAVPAVGVFFNGAPLTVSGGSNTNLSGKRILGVNVKYVASGPFAEISAARAAGLGDLTLYMRDDLGNFVSFGPLIGGPTLEQNTEIQTVRLGEINHFWNTSGSTPVSPFAQTDRYCWLGHVDPARFEATGAPRHYISVVFNSANLDPSLLVRLSYMALEFIYVDETRRLIGGKSFGDVTSGHAAYVRGENILTLRDTNRNPGTSFLLANDYTLVLASADIGDYAGDNALTENTAVPVASSRYPTLQGYRILYPIPSFHPFRAELTQRVNEEFVESTPTILPMLTLHASGSALDISQVYGRQYGTRPVAMNLSTMRQAIDDNPASGSYSQVRFYARHTRPVYSRLRMEALAASGVFAEITPADFDALPEIIDGWREVTLPLSTPLALPSGAGDPQFKFGLGSTTQPANEPLGWQVLAASAVAVSGYATYQGIHRLGKYTYGGPLSGDTVALTWSAPLLTGFGVDPDTDLVLMFSQEPPAVTGLAISPASQAVTGVLDECSNPVGCVPSAIAYHRVTWSPVSTSSLPTSGFGSYDLQRYDALDGQWRTIMLARSPAVTGFSDYEPRVGVESRYRIRCSNLYDFHGVWSSEVAATLAAPGVTVPGDGNSVLIFTTNERQSGIANLAHTMVWESGVDEQFTFPEASRVQIQSAYGRDGTRMFHGTERGLEQFNRTLLLGNAAVAAGALDRLSGNLRDLAWDDLSYVCVRDENGDRWLASIVVPDTSLRGRRRIQLTRITVLESTRVPSQPNGNLLSQGRPVSVMSVQRTEEPITTPLTSTPVLALDGPSMVDGDTQTSRWASQWLDPQYAIVDLERRAWIQTTVLRWHATGFARVYTLAVSDDQDTWTTVFTTSAGAGGDVVIPVNAWGRYVRMLGTSRNASGTPYSLYSFEVYG